MPTLSTATTSPPLRVALVEDDPSQAAILSHWLQVGGLTCSRYARGESLLRALWQQSFDVLLLDWSLPGMSGLDVLKQVRGAALRSSVPVLLISARASEADIVTALNQGADDYLIKPVRHQELLARIEAVHRRAATSKLPHPALIRLGALTVDLQARTARRNDRLVRLAPRDFDLAVLFLRNVGRLLSRVELREAVWGPDAAVGARMLDAYICRIRNKLGLTRSSGLRLVAVYGHGYRLEAMSRQVRTG